MSRRRQFYLLLALLAGPCLGACGTVETDRHELAQGTIEHTDARPLWTSSLHAPLSLRMEAASFSPDGQRLVVSLAEAHRMPRGEHTLHRLWVIGPGEPPRRVSEGPNDVSPVWSPSGTSVAYLHQVQPPEVARIEHLLSKGEILEAIRASANAVRVLDVDTVSCQELDLPEGIYGLPRWSPDGTSLACRLLQTDDDSGIVELALVELAEGTADLFPLGSDVVSIQSLAWSPGGNSIVLDEDALEGGQFVRRISVFDMSSESLRCVHTATERHVYDEVGFDSQSADPCFLAVEEHQGKRSFVLRRVDTETGMLAELARLVEPDRDELERPFVSPDGRGLAAIVWQYRDYTVPPYLLWTHDRTNGRFDVPAQSGIAGWSRDSRCIALTYGDQADSRIAVYKLPVQR